MCGWLTVAAVEDDHAWVVRDTFDLVHELLAHCLGGSPRDTDAAPRELHVQIEHHTVLVARIEPSPRLPYAATPCRSAQRQRACLSQSSAMRHVALKGAVSSMGLSRLDLTYTRATCSCCLQQQTGPVDGVRSRSSGRR